jgi:hypothetical protein
MMKWEYKLVTDIECKKAAGELNKLGEEGWELIAIDFPYHYFKRPKVEAEEETD